MSTKQSQTIHDRSASRGLLRLIWSIGFKGKISIGRCPLASGPGWETCPDAYRDHATQALVTGRYSFPSLTHLSESQI
jgi:hypothetical protein